MRPLWCPPHHSSQIRWRRLLGRQGRACLCGVCAVCWLCLHAALLGGLALTWPLPVGLPPALIPAPLPCLHRLPPPPCRSMNLQSTLEMSVVGFWAITIGIVAGSAWIFWVRGSGELRLGCRK